MSHRIRTTLAAALLALGAPVMTAARADAAQYPNLAPTPPMGWNNWSFYQCRVDEDIVLSNARALVSTGLAAKGYDTVTTDDCWMGKQRDANGDLVPDPVKFPRGMAYVGERLHALGLKFGIYEDAGTSTCAGFPGSLNHFQADADLFARWKVDYLKLDGCNVPVPAGQTKEQAYHTAYDQMSQALRGTGRPIVFSVSAPAYFQFDGDAVWHQVIAWSGEVGNLWREGADIALEQNSAASKWSSILFNYSYNVKLADLGHPGRWNDPDFLLAGDSGLTTDEIRSQMLLWATMAAPLISSTDLTKISPEALAVLGNRDVIAVDQDPLGLQGRIVQQDVLSKPLANGDRAVALFNSSDEARTITTTATDAGLSSAPSYLLKDLVSKQVTQTTGTISANLRPHATVLLRVHPGDASAPPSTAITWTKQGNAWRVGLTNNGGTALTDVTLSLSAPHGWTIDPASERLPRVRPGETASTVVTATGPAATTPGTTVSELTATARYQAGAAGRGSVSGDATVTTVVPFPTLADAFDNVGVTTEQPPPASGNYTTGDFDGDGNSYSAEALAAVGVTPGATLTANGVSWTWPDAQPGAKDNVVADGQAITLSGQGSKLWFLGSETGSGSAPVTVTYTDGTTSTGSLGFPNWCCTSDAGAVTVATSGHRNTQAGPANFNVGGYKLFGNPVALEAGKTVKTVTLPKLASIHVFAISLQP